jgi:hypothetical protein
VPVKVVGAVVEVVEVVPVMVVTSAAVVVVVVMVVMVVAVDCGVLAGAPPRPRQCPVVQRSLAPPARVLTSAVAGRPPPLGSLGNLGSVFD